MKRDGGERRMMKRNLLTIVLLFILPFTVFALMGEDLDRTKVSMPEAAEALLPENGVVIAACEGDLNEDGQQDYLVVFEYLDDDRELIVLVNTGHGTYRVAARSKNAVLRSDDGGVYGDPFVRIWVDKGSFGVDHFGGSNWKWSNNSGFEYSASQGTWYLTFFQTDQYDLDNNDTQHMYTVKDFGRVTLEEFDMSKITAGEGSSTDSEPFAAESSLSEDEGDE